MEHINKLKSGTPVVPEASTLPATEEALATDLSEYVRRWGDSGTHAASDGVPVPPIITEPLSPVDKDGNPRTPLAPVDWSLEVPTGDMLSDSEDDMATQADPYADICLDDVSVPSDRDSVCATNGDSISDYRGDTWLSPMCCDVSLSC